MLRERNIFASCISGDGASSRAAISLPRRPDPRRYDDGDLGRGITKRALARNADNAAYLQTRPCKASSRLIVPPRALLAPTLRVFSSDEKWKEKSIFAGLLFNPYRFARGPFFRTICRSESHNNRDTKETSFHFGEMSVVKFSSREIFFKEVAVHRRERGGKTSESILFKHSRLIVPGVRTLVVEAHPRNRRSTVFCDSRPRWTVARRLRRPPPRPRPPPSSRAHLGSPEAS